MELVAIVILLCVLAVCITFDQCSRRNHHYLFKLLESKKRAD